jgi:putative ABC transport system substrate-binding protein
MQKKTVGALWGGGVSDVSFIRDAFLGMLQGPGITIKDEYAEGKVSDFPDLAAELVEIPVDVIVASGTPAAQAAKNATATIPIVFAAVGDPNLVQAPNVTGVCLAEPAASARRLELLYEAVKGVKNVAVLWNKDNPVHSVYLAKMQLVASQLGITLQLIGMSDFKLGDALNTLAAGKPPDALVVLPDPSFHKGRSQIMSSANANKLPAMYSQSSYVEEDGLMSYGPNYPFMYQQAAGLVNNILATGKITDVEPVKRSDLVINLKIAKQIGLTIPPSVRDQAILVDD